MVCNMAVVRIDDDLLKKIKEFLGKNDNKYRYPSVASFVNNVIYEKLNGRKEKN